MDLEEAAIIEELKKLDPDYGGSSDVTTLAVGYIIETPDPALYKLHLRSSKGDKWSHISEDEVKARGLDLGENKFCMRVSYHRKDGSSNIELVRMPTPRREPTE